MVRAWEDAPWPGNVRELRNAVARRVALGDLDDGAPAPSAPGIGADGGARTRTGPEGDTLDAILALDLPYADARTRIQREFDQRYIDRLLELHDGNIERAAAAAGIGKRHFHRIKSRSTSS